MIRNLWVVIALFCVFVSCGNKEKVGIVFSKGIEENHSINTFSKDLIMNSYVDTVSFILLDDSKEESLLKDINKCIIKNNRIYILDFFGTELVKVFDLSGKFLFMVGAKGGGPGEFFRTFDFDVNDNGVFLLDVRNRKIIEYDLNGLFREEYNYNDKLSGINSFIVTNQSNFLLSMSQDAYPEAKVLLVDKKFNIIQKVLAFNKTETKELLRIGSFRRCGENIVYHYPISDDIYLFEQSGEISAKYTLSLNEKPIDDDIKSNYRKVVSERSSGQFNYFHEVPFFNGTMLLTTMFYGSNKALFCLDMKEHKYAIESYEGILELFTKLSIKNFNFPVYIDENRVICALNQLVYDRMKEKDAVDESSLKSLSEGATMLIVYHLKQKKDVL